VKSEWDGLPPSLTSNKIDLIIAGMTDDPARRLTIDFTDIYWSSDMVIVVRKDGPYAQASNLLDFAGAKITAQQGTIHYTQLIDEIPDVDKQAAMADFPTMLMALSAGRIDGYVAERPAAISANISNPDVIFIAFEPGKGFSEEVPISIGIRKGEDDLKAKINEILAGISIETRQEMMSDAVERQPLSAEG
jgi:putative lysine transport system substrate-binding protein